MGMELLTFAAGMLAGVAIMLFPMILVDDKNVWYQAGYRRGYEKGKREAEGKDG